MAVVALANDGRRDESRQVVDAFKQRHPDFDSARVTAVWSSTNAHPKFVEGRDRIVTTLRELGLP